jgi:Lar family restriction alleviation protein
MTPTDTLKPCPFCGGLQLVMMPYEPYYQECLDCGASGPWGKSPEEAVALWNKRAAVEVTNDR